MIQQIWDDIRPLRAPAGGEGRLAQQIRAWVQAEGDVRADRAGNLLFERPGPGPRRLLLVGLDEPTFALAGTSDGRASFALYGCVLTAAALCGRAVRVGEDLAVIGGPDEASRVSDLWLDCDPARPAEPLGTWATEQTERDGRAIGRACGPRMLQAVAVAHALQFKGALTLAFAAKTGVGEQGIAPLLREGAFDEAAMLVPVQRAAKVGDGALLVRHMPGMSSDLSLSERLSGAAKDVIADESDRAALARPVRQAGIPCVALGLPVGYRTGPWETISFRDAEQLLFALGKLQAGV